MSKENIFVPLPEAQTDRLRITVSLPLGVEKNVGISIRDTHRLLQVGGIRSLSINSQGAASAGRAALNTIPTHREIFQTDRLPVHQARWVDLDISLNTSNTSEMQQRVLEAKKSIREASVWAREINQAVTHAIVCAGVSHLLKDIGIPDVFGMVLYYQHQLWFIASPGIIPAYLRFALPCGFWNFCQSMLWGKEQSGSGYRISLFVAGPEFDRAFLLLLLGKTRTLVKELKEDTIQEKRRQK